MTAWIDSLRGNIPDYAKLARQNLDSVIKRSSVDVDHAQYCALSAAFATGNSKLWSWLHQQLPDSVQANTALSAASNIAQSAVWHSYIAMAGDSTLATMPANLKLDSAELPAGIKQSDYDAYCLSASIISKCEWCIKHYYQKLENQGYSKEQLRDIGRIASVVNSVSRVLSK